MKYILTNDNVVFAIHSDDQEVGSLYPGFKVWITGEQHEIGDTVTVTVSFEDYDRALEKHLLDERVARGYTTREPDTYINSEVPRWKQDALDWVAHKDVVMLYALQVQNDYKEGLPVPTLEQFKTQLPKIQWTIE